MVFGYKPQFQEKCLNKKIFMLADLVTLGK
jgi:hypothetical protein